jgi:hypothetical protein
VAITGLQAGENVLAIDVRPLTGELYALGSTSRLYTLNPASGAATLVGTGTFSPTLSGTDFGMDFNPAVDRVRIVSDEEQNIRLHPTSGAVFVDTPLSPPGNIVAAAYDRNAAGTTATTLFGIDAGTDELVRIGGVDGSPSPNGGAVTAIGALGVDTSALAGFDVGRNGRAYALLTVSGEPRLFEIILATGAARLLGTLGTGAVAIRDIAAWQPPHVYLPLAAGPE